MVPKRMQNENEKRKNGSGRLMDDGDGLMVAASHVRFFYSISCFAPFLRAFVRRRRDVPLRRTRARWRELGFEV